MAIRKAEMRWEGNLKNGSGMVSVESGALRGPISYASRFESGTGTNPEELIGAAFAGCYSMALSGDLERAGYTPLEIHTTASVHLNKAGQGYRITKIELESQARVGDISPEAFQKIADAASRECPVAQALKGTEVVHTARLNSIYS